MFPYLVSSRLYITSAHFDIFLLFIANKYAEK